MITIRRQFPASARHLALVLLVLGFVPLGCSRDKHEMNTLTGASTADGIELNAPTILE